MSTQEQIDQLDATGERWSLYRAHDHRWIVSLGEGHDDPGARTASGFTIEEALAAAVASPRLPVVPQCPRLQAWEIEKTGREYRVHPVGVTGGYRATSKADAEQIRSKAIDAERAAVLAWEREYGGFVTRHQAGVDFYWAKY